MSKKKTDILKGLTVKRQRFVLAMMKEATATDAVHKAGYNVKNQESAHTVATKLMAAPKVRLAISQMILLENPNASRDISFYLMGLINGHYEDAKLSDRLAAVDKVLKIFGEYAATKKASLNLDAKDFFQLPGEG